MGALSGLGQGLSDIGARNAQEEMMKEREFRAGQRDVEMLKLRDEMDMARTKNLAEWKAKKENEKYDRFSSRAKELAQEEIPLEAEAVNKLTQGSASSLGLESGIQGDRKDIEGIIARFQGVANDPNSSQEEKMTANEILDQISKQYGAQESINQKAVEGKTRQRGKDEVFNDTYDQLLIDDPEAALSMAPALREKRIEKKEDAAIAYNKERTALADKQFEQSMSMQSIAQQRAAETLALQIRRQDAYENAASEKERSSIVADMRKSTEGSLKSAETQLKELNKERENASPERLRAIENEALDVKDEISGYRQALSTAGFPVIKVEREKPVPTQETIDLLIKNPDKAAEFEREFGISADQFLNQKGVQQGIIERTVTKRTPEPPREKEWVGNNYQTTSEYQKWNDMYGDEYRNNAKKKDAYRNARMAESLSKLRD